MANMCILTSQNIIAFALYIIVLDFCTNTFCAPYILTNGNYGLILEKKCNRNTPSNEYLEPRDHSVLSTQLPVFTLFPALYTPLYLLPDAVPHSWIASCPACYADLPPY